MSEPTRWWLVAGCNTGFATRDGIDYVSKCFPGSKDTVCRPLQPADLELPELAAAYDAFLTGAAGPTGTPLKALGLEPSMVKSLESSGVESVEALASLNDTFVMTIREGFSLKRKAQAYLAENAIPPAIQRAIDGLRQEITELRKRLEGESK
jgi:hypothetical protein